MCEIGGSCGMSPAGLGVVRRKASDKRGASDAGGSSLVGSTEDGCGSGGGGGNSGDGEVKKEGPMPAGTLPFATQERKVKNKRSRLSLPTKKRAGNGRDGSKTSSDPGTPVVTSQQRADTAGLAAKESEQAAETKQESPSTPPAAAVDGDCRQGLDTDDTAAAVAAAAAAVAALSAGNDCELPGKDVGGAVDGVASAGGGGDSAMDVDAVGGVASAAAAGSAMDVDADPSHPVDGGLGTAGEAGDDEHKDEDTDIDERCGTKNPDENRAKTEGPEDLDGNGGTLSPCGGGSEEEVEEDDCGELVKEDSASLTVGEGERESVEGGSQEAAPVATESSNGAVAASGDAGTEATTGGPAQPQCRALAGCRMTMDVGSSDSDSSDDDGDTARGGAGEGGGGGAVHLGRAFDEAVTHSSPSPYTTAAAAASPPPRSAPASVAGISEEDADQSAAALSPAARTPSPRRRSSRAQGKGTTVAAAAAAASPEDSQDAAAMGLVDTPPPKKKHLPAGTAASSPSSTSSEVKKVRKKTPRRRTLVERLGLGGGGSQPHGGSQPSPEAFLSSSQGRGGWTCGQCTLFNRGRAKACEACGRAKASSPALTRAATHGGPVGRVDGARNADSGGFDAVANGGSGVNGGSSGGGGGGGGGSDDDGGDSRCRSSREPRKIKNGRAGDEDVGDRGPGLGKRRRQDAGDDEDIEVDDAGAAAESTLAYSPDSADGNGGEGEQQATGRAGAAASGTRGGRKGAAAATTAAAVQGFVGDDDAVCLEESEEDDWEGEGGDGDDSDDEDYFDAQDGDSGVEDAEVVGSQIEEVFLQSRGRPLQQQQQQQRSRVQSMDSSSSSNSVASSKKRQRPVLPQSGLVLDLTDAVNNESSDEDAAAAGAAVWGKGRDDGRRVPAPAGAAPNDVEEIDDDDDDDDFDLPGLRGSVAASAGGGSGASAARQEPPRKFRCFASVREHRDRGTSCVDFASLESAPAGGPSGTKTYAARKTARDRKGKSKSKRGKRKSRAAAPRAAPRAPRATPASAGAAGHARGKGGSARGGRGGGRAGSGSFRSGGRQPFGGAGGAPTASWIPAGVAAAAAAAARSSSSSSAGGGKRGGGGGGGAGGSGNQPRPFNHYRGNDEMVDDSIGGGGFHWEGVGQTSFGGDH
ncbi:unnamed protein product [Pylaiella littoralis]